MPGSTRLRALVGLVLLAWVVAIAVWAVRPLSDSVPVGLDRSVTPNVLRSVEVRCNDLFAADPRPDEPLPALAPQPEGQPALGFQREPCALVHTNARRLLALNAGALVAVVVAGALALRHRRRTPAAS